LNPSFAIVTSFTSIFGFEFKPYFHYGCALRCVALRAWREK